MGRIKYPLDFIVIFFLLHSLNVMRNDYGNGEDVRNNGERRATSSLFFAAAAEDEDAEKKYRAFFVADIKKLLEHNRVFYNAYGVKDAEVDLAFDEAKIAADIIYLYPQFFREKIQIINFRIEDALKRKKDEEESNVAVTADGVPVYFVDKGLLLIGALGGMGVIRFPPVI